MSDRPTFGSLFTGIGGLDLGLERAGWECRWQVELDEWCRAVLARHWPHVPRSSDIRAFAPDPDSSVDLIAGGFPCQDISSARHGGQRGLAGSQSGLWWEFARIVRGLGPRWVLVENSGSWKRWVPEVRTELARAGYASVPLALSAGSFGAPHIRSRCFVVAHTNGDGQPLRAIHEQVAALSPVPIRSGAWTGGPVRVDDGIPGRVDRLRGLGNAVVPQVAEYIGRRLMATVKEHSAR